jgi:hypothetical protein
VLRSSIQGGAITEAMYCGVAEPVLRNVGPAVAEKLGSCSVVCIAVVSARLRQVLTYSVKVACKYAYAAGAFTYRCSAVKNLQTPSAVCSCFAVRVCNSGAREAD